MFKPVNSELRRPAFLQDLTKQNVIFQLALGGAIIGAVMVKDELDRRKFEKKVEASESESK